MSDGVRVARNAPCPCGSGKKYKRCCGKDAPSQWAGDSVWHRLRAAEGRLVPEILEWALTRYGSDILSVAWEHFVFGDDEEEEDGELPREHPEFGGLFVPWSLFTWTAYAGEGWPEDWPRTPLGLAYLDARGDRLDALERRFLEAVCARPYSFHQVLSVEPGCSLRLRDLLTGEEWQVSE
jgi:hypothetical protein